MRSDPSGEFFISAIIALTVVVFSAVTLTGCSSKPVDPAPRKDLAAAPNLDVKKAASRSYNCYGNGIGKQIIADPTGYKIGDSTAKTYEAVKKDLGGDKNVRKLDSINAKVNADEFKVAMKCGPRDYHFIRLDSGGWYNKSGTAPGLYIDQSIVAGKVWYAMWMTNGEKYYNPNVYYNDETIYFAVKVGWDK